jgi:hypothetical protein
VSNVWLVQCAPYDIGAAAETTLYFSTGRPDGLVPVYDGKLWPVRAISPLNVDLTVFSGEFGGAVPTFGAVTIDIGGTGAELDALLGYAWDGRDILIYRGQPTDTFASMTLVFKGQARSVSWTRRVLTIALSDYGETLAKPAQTTLYASTGGAEGGDDLNGKTKPLAFGQVFNAEPTLISAAYLVYQAHSRSIEAVSGVFDRAMPLEFGSDRASYAALIAATVKAGYYDTCLAEGMIRLGAMPVGPVTMDLQGDDTGGYVDTAADIIERHAVDFTEFTSSNINAASFADLNTANSAACGIYVGTGENPSCADLYSQLMLSVGGFWMLNPASEIVVRQIAYSTVAATLTEATIVDDVERLETPPPYWRSKFGWARSWRVHNESEVAGAAASSIAIDINQQNFTTASNGKAFIHGLNIDGGRADTDGTYYYGPDLVTLPRAQFADGSTLKTSQQSAGYIVHDYDPVTASFKDLFAGTAATDLASRSPDTGTSWTDVTGITQKFRVNGSGQAAPTGTASAVRVIYRANPAPSSADMFVEVQLDVAPAYPGDIGLIARYQSSTSMYVLSLGQFGADLSLQIIRITGSGTGSSVTSATTVRYIAGMKARLTCRGSTLAAWVRMPGTTIWQKVLEGTDSNIASSGHGGLYTGALYNSFNVATDAKLSNFRNGVLSGGWTVSTEKVAAVFARFDGANWEYDTGSGWTDFTRSDTMLVIGTLDRGASSISSAALTMPQKLPATAAKTVIERGAFVRERQRFVTSEDSGIKTIHKLAREREVASLLAEETDADTENDRQHALLDAKWDLYQVTIQQSKWDELGLEIGDTITLKLSRFGLSAGKNFIIGGKTTGRSADWCRLLLWGGV